MENLKHIVRNTNISR